MKGTCPCQPGHRTYPPLTVHRDDTPPSNICSNEVLCTSFKKFHNFANQHKKKDKRLRDTGVPNKQSWQIPPSQVSKHECSENRVDPESPAPTSHSPWKRVSLISASRSPNQCQSPTFFVSSFFKNFLIVFFGVGAIKSHQPNFQQKTLSKI